MINRLTHYQQLLTRSKDNYKALVGVIQVCSTLDAEENFRKNKMYIDQCSERGAKLICLPENFNFMAISYQQSVQVAQRLDGAYLKKYKQLALDNRVWLSLGGFQEQCENLNKRYNTHILINEEGNIVQSYRKLHLFDVDLAHRIPGTQSLREEDFIEPGYEIPDPISSPIGYLGLSISNDLRYPELYRRYVQRGAQVLLVSSAFLLKTGSAHWETLIKARAIENQCYVVAANQVGIHHEKRQSYGHSMVVDPWGDIIGQMSDKEGCFVCEIDLEYLDKVRGNMACLTHMRHDVINNPDK